MFRAGLPGLPRPAAKARSSSADRSHLELAPFLATQRSKIGSKLHRGREISHVPRLALIANFLLHRVACSVSEAFLTPPASSWRQREHACHHPADAGRDGGPRLEHASDACPAATVWPAAYETSGLSKSMAHHAILSLPQTGWSRSAISDFLEPKTSFRCRIRGPSSERLVRIDYDVRAGPESGSESGRFGGKGILPGLILRVSAEDGRNGGTSEDP
jgi:hypothetical protein